MRQQYGGGYGPPSKPTTASSSAAASGTAASSDVTGGQTCTPYMCITGVVNGSSIQCASQLRLTASHSRPTSNPADTLQSQGKAALGWMAVCVPLP